MGKAHLVASNQLSGWVHWGPITQDNAIGLLAVPHGDLNLPLCLPRGSRNLPSSTFLSG